MKGRHGPGVSAVPQTIYLLEKRENILTVEKAGDHSLMKGPDRESPKSSQTPE